MRTTTLLGLFWSSISFAEIILSIQIQPNPCAIGDWYEVDYIVENHSKESIKVYDIVDCNGCYAVYKTIRPFSNELIYSYKRTAKAYGDYPYKPTFHTDKGIVVYDKPYVFMIR